MSFLLFNPAGDLLKALGIDVANVERYSLIFSADDLTKCKLELQIRPEAIDAFQTELKRFTITFEPLEAAAEPKAEPELYLLQDGPTAAADAHEAQAPVPIDMSIPPHPFSRARGFTQEQP